MASTGRLFCALSIAVVLAICLEARAEEFGDLGEFGLSVGVMDPQGDFSRFADTGFHAKGHLSLRAPSTRMFALWIDGNYTWFGSQQSAGLIEFENGETVTVIQETRQSAWSLHLGPQFGSPTSKGFMRPRAGLGIGGYLFVVDVNEQLPGFQDPIDLDTTYLGRFGWRANIGLDLFARSEWGFSLDFLYDQVWNLNLTLPDGSKAEHPVYIGFTVGFVLALQYLE